MPSCELIAVSLLALSLSLPACTTFEVASNADQPEDATNGYETVAGSLYGIAWSKYNAQKCDDGPLAKVEFHYNALQFLASTFTLGLYVPQTVEWWCTDPSSESDDDEPGLDSNGEFSAHPTAGSEGRPS